MNQAMVDKIAQAVLYEGYNLYPYRPSVKSRCRWTFGGLYPRPYSEAGKGTDAWSMQVQCLLQAGPAASARPLPYETAEKVETDTRSSTEYSVLSAIRSCSRETFSAASLRREIDVESHPAVPTSCAAHDRRAGRALRRIARGKRARLSGRRFAAAGRDTLSELAGGGPARSDDRAAGARLRFRARRTSPLSPPLPATLWNRSAAPTAGSRQSSSAIRKPSKAPRRSPPTIAGGAGLATHACGSSIARRWHDAAIAQPRRGPAAVARRHACRPRRAGWKVLFFDRPARGPAQGHGRLPEPRRVAGPRRFARRARRHAGLAHHPL